VIEAIISQSLTEDGTLVRKQFPVGNMGARHSHKLHYIADSLFFTNCKLQSSSSVRSEAERTGEVQSHI
jgi:hypothetical protein